jgi:hypothetical protein
MDSVIATLDAYSAKRIAADAAAKVLVDYMMGGGQPMSLEMDADLRAAVDRESKKRQRS